MPVTNTMITELSDALLNDQSKLNPSFRLGSFKREGVLARLNDKAIEKNLACTRVRYDGQSIYTWLKQALMAYELLQTNSVDLDPALGEHAWLLPYLPVFQASIFNQLMEKHRTDYLYSEENEICVQTMTILMLSYHSNPELFTKSPTQFEAIANSWLRTILTFNEVKNPMLKSHIEGWNDDAYCSTGRNLSYMQFCAEASYKASKPFAEILNTPQWVNRVMAFDELNKVVFRVLKLHEKLNSYAFIEAVRRLQYIQLNQREFTQEPVIASVVTGISQSNHAMPTAKPVKTYRSPPDVAIASTEQEEMLRETGINLIRSGMARLNISPGHLQIPTASSISLLINNANKLIDSVHELMNANPARSSYEKREPILSALFEKQKQIESLLLSMMGREPEMTVEDHDLSIRLDERSQDTTKRFENYIELVTRPPSHITETIRKQMMEMVRKDDAIQLQQFIRNMSTSNIQEEACYVLRNAAHLGLKKCLSVLCGPFPAYPIGAPLSEGKTTHKIALHFAIEAGHADCVEVLLNTLCGTERAPVSQLLFGNMPNRPLDMLNNIKDNARCFKVCDAIATAINSIDDPVNGSQENKHEIHQVLEKIRHERLQANSSFGFS